MLEIGHIGWHWHADEGNCRAFNQMNSSQHAHLGFFSSGIQLFERLCSASESLASFGQSKVTISHEL